ncbi:MAG: methyltransferase domain-containing protein [Gammaproteobacteria bacterium]|nr:methyltransferase domain-containing protein [Gammaproteobacteria bacterium]
MIASAGIEKGMQVLEFGCGNGEVSLLLAEAVGPEGRIVGLDSNESVLEMARNRVQDKGLSQVEFIKEELSETTAGLGEFDAIFGRRILMYLHDPVSILTNFSNMLKSGGVLAFQESDSTLASGCIEALPLHEKVNGWLWRMVEGEGGNIHMGFELPSILSKSGFIVEGVRAEAIIQGQKLHYPLADVVRAVLPRIVGQGIATEDEIDIETLQQRLDDERPEHAVFISDLPFSVWARKP